MFQRTLILAAISAAFAQVPPIRPCEKITEKLQRAFLPEDPHTFPIISDVNYIRDNISYSLDIFNLTFIGFSNVSCSSFNPDNRVASLTLEGTSLGFSTYDAEIRSVSGFSNLVKTPFSSWLRDYTLEMSFVIESYRSYPFSLCITRDSLLTTSLLK
ncbi:uncharacterized protein [Palaemon carinicauda]|uniref:uncharacterized protein n=1 Tax=Palaemon carinicauda TaxID=392227 RepID=UPI0035B57580